MGTIHSGAGVVVETLVPVGEGFEDPAKQILPLDSAELRDLRVAACAQSL